MERGPISRKKKKKKKKPRERIGGEERTGRGVEVGFALGGGLLEEIRGEKLGTEKWRGGGPASKGKWWQGKKRGRESLLKFAAMPAGEESRPHPPRAKCSP